MTTPDIEAIKKRAEAATEGPWVAAADGIIWHEVALTQECCGHPRVVCDDDGAGNAVPAYEVCCGEPVVQGGQEPIAQSSGADAIFIAHARSDIPALLSYIDTLKAEHEAELMEVIEYVGRNLPAMKPFTRAQAVQWLKEYRAQKEKK